jgi:hypothetical protein
VFVELKYTTRDNTALTETEKSNITTTITDALNQIDIGDYVSIKLLESICYQSVSFGRLRDVAIRLKDMTLVGSDFTSVDLLANYDEKPRLLSGNITFGRL